MSVDEFIQRVRIQSQGNIWSTLIIDNLNFEEVVEELKDSISIFAECEIQIISGEQRVENLIGQVQDSSEDYLIIYKIENWHQDDWKKIDEYRSFLDQHKLGGLIIVSANTAKQMVNNAPNFTSWLGSKIYNLELDTELLNEEEKELRLVALREWAKKSDEDIIALAEENQLPSDPEYGEWLILLDRGDLIEQY